ncbi:MAG: hypothetical protein N2490_07090 [Ignavibacteria bacterium]|nr:hypothetical protein [Ignavibacteria bacterium]
MRKIFTFSLILVLATIFVGCDRLLVATHYVTIYNDDYDKYITCVYVRDYYGYGGRWSKNQINGYIYPGESESILLDEGRYDFKIVMEDDYYSYTIFEEDVAVYSDITLYISYYKLSDTQKSKVIKVPKAKE